MPKNFWMTVLFAAALLGGCNRSDPMPQYPYEVPREGEKDVAEVHIDGAILGHSIAARRLHNDAPFELYVADIFAPAKGQAWHSESIAALDKLVKGKRARVWVQEVVPVESSSGLGAVVRGRVYVDGKDISWELVGSGNAWVWEARSDDDELMRLQAWARRNKKGLWALPESEREPPWKYMERVLGSPAAKRNDKPD